VASGFSLGDEIADCHRLIAVGTAPPRPDPATEEMAIRAPLLVQVARPARWALVHRRQATGRGRPRRRRGARFCRGVAASPSSLTAGIRTEAASARRLEGAPADRANPSGYRYAIVMRRDDAAGRALGGNPRAGRTPRLGRLRRAQFVGTSAPGFPDRRLPTCRRARVLRGELLHIHLTQGRPQRGSVAPGACS
jgi:hypothetical protein